jgi:hypothetical protein
MSKTISGWKEKLCRSSTREDHCVPAQSNKAAANKRASQAKGIVCLFDGCDGRAVRISRAGYLHESINVLHRLAMYTGAVWAKLKGRMVQIKGRAFFAGRLTHAMHSLFLNH